MMTKAEIAFLVTVSTLLRESKNLLDSVLVISGVDGLPPSDIERLSGFSSSLDEMAREIITEVGMNIALDSNEANTTNTQDEQSDVRVLEIL